MEVMVRDITGNKMALAFSGTDLTVVNGIRRVMIADVPSLAIDHVEIELNTTALADR